jgi:hypothetical protein
MAEITLSGGYVALVDDEDLPMLAAFRWRAMKMHGQDRYVYVVSGAKKVVAMHRLITGAPKGLVVDHINGNRLDNRKENLRVCTHAQNLMNRASKRKFKGVRLREGGRWQAAIRVGGVRHCLGGFETAEEAARAYDDAAVRLHGEFARLNFRRNHGAIF